MLSRSVYARGDVDAALGASAHTMHEVFQTQRIEHAFLEPESSLAVPSGDDAARRLHVYSGGQGVWDDRDDICRVLAVDTDVVTVELVSNGGALGGKEDMANQPHVALAAWLLDRPVKCTLSRRRASASTPSATLCASSTGPAVTPTACSRPCGCAPSATRAPTRRSA